MCLIMPEFVKILKHLVIKKYYIAVVILSVCRVHEVRSQKYSIPSSSNNQNRVDSCRLPTGMVSHCVPLKRCHQINVLFESLPEPRSNQITNFLNSSFLCNKETSLDETLVCCPEENVVNSELAQRQHFGDTGIHVLI